MTDDERKRLNEIERQYTAMGNDAPVFWSSEPVFFLRALARRLEKLETIIPTFLNDRAADEDWLVKRDCVVRDEAAKMAARECVRLALDVNKMLDNHGALQAAASIKAHFSLDQSGPALTERVERETAERCIEIAEQVALDSEVAGAQAETIINAVREVFGLCAGGAPLTQAQAVAAHLQAAGFPNVHVMDPTPGQ